MTKRIEGLPDVVKVLAFSADGRYLAAACGSGGLRVFDRDKNWSEVFRDDTYGARSNGAAFAGDGRLATTSYDGKVRLYDRSFKLIATQETLTGRRPGRIAFRPDGKVLAVGYGDTRAVDLLDGQSLARLPGPNVDGLYGGGFIWGLFEILGEDLFGDLFVVAWAADGQTLFASGRNRDQTGNIPVFAWGPGWSRNTPRNSGEVC